MANWTRFALSAAALCMAAAPSAIAQTTSEDSEDVLLVADEVYELDEQNQVVAEGNVEARYQGRVLRADKLIYDRTTQRVRASGNVVILDPDGTQRFADEIEVVSNLSDGYAIGFSARLPNGATTAANAAIRESNGINAFDQVVYTACELCDEDDTPTWTIRARRAVLDERSQMFSYRDAVVELAGVPVFYMPFFAHPDPSSGRRSGLLAPSLGTSTKFDYFYQQPYYWAISPHSDLTIAPLVTGGTNPLLELDYRKRFWSGNLEINASGTKEQLFDSDGDKFGDKSWRSHLYARGLFNITPRWSWGFGAERASDDLYTQRYSLDGENKRRGLYNSQPRRLLSQLFLIGQDTDFYADAAVFNIQGLRAGDDDAELPSAAPLLFAEQLYDLGAFGQGAVSASTAFLNRNVGADSRRASVAVDWSKTSVLPGGVLLEPFSETRLDYYAFDSDVSPEANVTRAVGNVGARLSYPLFRPGKNVDLLVTPIAMGAWGLSNVNDPAILNEDTQLYEFDETSLFEANGFNNFDLYEGDGKAALGFSTQMRWKGGTRISTIAGRRWRSRSDPTFGVSTNLDGTVSDWVGGVNAYFGRRLSIATRVRLDDDTFELNRIDARLRTEFWRARMSLGYYKVDDDIGEVGNGDEGIQIFGSFRITDNYSLTYGRLRNIQDAFDARHALGIAYEDECSRFEIAFERSEFRDRELEPSDSIQFRFSLKTLGEFGSNTFD